MQQMKYEMLRLRFESEIAVLQDSTTAMKNELRQSAEVCANPLMDAVDCAKDEVDLKSKIRVYNHTMMRMAELKNALQSMANGNFGICRVCGKPIGAQRLQAHPASELCFECQANKEHGSGLSPQRRMAA